jgi:hypothetical protein
MFFAEAKAATKVSCSVVLTVAAAAGYASSIPVMTDCVVGFLCGGSSRLQQKIISWLLCVSLFFVGCGVGSLT